MQRSAIWVHIDFNDRSGLGGGTCVVQLYPHQAMGTVEYSRRL